MYKLFVVTFAGGKAIDTQVLEYNSPAHADNAYDYLTAASGNSFNCVITKLYTDLS